MKKAVAILLGFIVLAAVAVVIINFPPLFPSEAADSLSSEGTHIYVGYPFESPNYKTVQAAVDAAEKIAPRSENERVYIHIAPGVYREQVIVNASYISFINDCPDKEVKITWYYGIGYEYYSMGEDGFYSEEAARQRSEKREANRWGCSVRILGDRFRAEYITFENSFNRYVTLKEILDGVEPSGSQSITFKRTLGANVQTKDATERAAALAVEGDYCEFFGCSMLSGQDTLFTRGIGYYKNCTIEGNTDYIFGQGDNVFEDCSLRFKGFSGESKGGVITAIKDDGKYLFYNCEITANDELTVLSGRFGRPWGPAADVAFVNTRLEYASIISAEGWSSMSGNEPQNANFKEYNSTADGESVATFGRVDGTVLFSGEGLTPEEYLGAWTPHYFDMSAVSR